MFHYTKGRNDSFKDIAIKHYEGLKAVKVYKTKTFTSYYKQSVIKKTNHHAANAKGKNGHFFKDLVANNYELLERIITGDHQILSDVIGEFKKQQAVKRYPAIYRKNKNGEKKITPFGRLVKDVFDYDAFVDKKSHWTAYHLTELLGIDVCAYCNRNYTYTLSAPKYTVRPELDHFLPKSDYPFLALSFYNLIPSCHTCNSNLKLKTDFEYDKNIHPYLQSIDEVIRFSLKLKKKTTNPLNVEKDHFGVAFFYGDPESFEIVLKSRKTALPFKDGKFNTMYFRKALNNIQIFKIKELYNFHKDLVVEIIQTAIIYNDDYVESLYQAFSGTLFNSKSDVIRLVTRNYHLPDDIAKRPFSKLTKDIFEELGLTYTT